MGNSSGPFIVPVAVFVWLSIIAIAKNVGQVHARSIAADQRIAMVQRAMTPEQIAIVLQPTKEDEVELGARIDDPLRSLGNARRTAIVLVRGHTSVMSIIHASGYFKTYETELALSSLACCSPKFSASAKC